MSFLRQSAFNMARKTAILLDFERPSLHRASPAYCHHAIAVLTKRSSQEAASV